MLSGFVRYGVRFFAARMDVESAAFLTIQMAPRRLDVKTTIIERKSNISRPPKRAQLSVLNCGFFQRLTPGRPVSVPVCSVSHVPVCTDLNPYAL